MQDPLRYVVGDTRRPLFLTSPVLAGSMSRAGNYRGWEALIFLSLLTHSTQAKAENIDKVEQFL